MELAIKILALSIMVRLLVAIEKPWLSAGIYTVLVFGLGVAFGKQITSAAISAGLVLVITFVYFWILSRLESSSIAWWIVAIVGIPVVFL